MRGGAAGGPHRLLEALAPGLGSASLAVAGLTAALYLAMALAGPGGSPFSLPTRMLVRFGAKYTPLIAAGEWWRLVNPIFLHASIIHVGFNVYALASLGPVVEEVVGGRRFLVIYVATGMASFAASAWFAPGSLSVGCSGALFGLIGFGIAHGYLRGSRRLAGQLTRWALFGAILLLVPGIDHAAHAGGLVAGLLLGSAIGGPPARSAWLEGAWTAAAAVAVLVCLAGFVAAAAAPPAV